MMRNIRALIIDDTENARKTIKNNLGDFHIVFSEAQDGTSALDLMKTRNFDVTFLDLKLPDLAGLEVLAKAYEQRRDLGRVIVLTGLPEPESEKRAKELGVFRYLTKNPINRQQLRDVFVEAIANFTSVPRAKPKGRIARLINKSQQRHPGTLKQHRNTLPKILVLDDKRSWLKTIQRELGRSFNLSLTTSPEIACRRIRGKGFALVVLDMVLAGGISGLDILGRMRKSVPDLRAIILTGQPEYKSALESGRQGALGYVSKGKLTTLAGIIQKTINQPAKPVRVFLSYQRSDKAKVLRLYNRLMARGFLPWMDIKSIIAGKKWEPEIRTAIEQCDYFIFCVSHNSRDKEGTIRKEVKQALERQEGLLDSSIFFIPARLEDCELTEPFRRFQYVDLFKSDGFTKLLQALSFRTKDDR